MTKALICGVTGAEASYDAQSVLRGMEVPVTFSPHAIRREEALSDDCASFVYALSMTIAALLRDKRRYDDTPGSLLLAYDMPILKSYWEEQEFAPFGHVCGFGSESWAVCRKLVSEAYRFVGFDYIFVYGDALGTDLLATNGLLGRGAVVRVSRNEEVATILGRRVE